MESFRDYLICPITNLIFREPVKASDGHTYEREAIEEWFAQNNTSPMSGNVIGKNLLADFSMNSLVENFIQKNPHEEENRYAQPKNYFDAPDEVKIKFVQKKYKDLLKYRNFNLLDMIDEDQNIMKAVSMVPKLDIFKYIYQNSINKNEQDKMGNYLIHYVVSNSPLSFVQYLYSQGVNLNITTKNYNYTPLHLAIQNPNDKNDQIVLFLINNGAETNAKAGNNSYDNFTPLYYAFESQKSKLVNILWTGTDDNQTFGFGKTKPIHLLAEYLPIQFLKLLKSKDSRIGQTDIKGSNAIFYLFRSDLSTENIIIEALNIILKSNKLWKLANKPGSLQKTPIRLLIEKFPNNVKIWDMLFKKKDLDLKNDTGEDVDLGTFIRMTKNDQIMIWIINYIKKSKCHNLKGYQDWTPLHYMIVNKKSDKLILTYLEVVGFHHCLTRNNDTILNYVIKWKPHLLNEFIDYFNDVNIPNNQYVFPIHDAARYLGLEGIKLLINKGADPNMRTIDGFTPLTMLLKYQPNDVISYLKKIPNIEVDTVYKDGTGLLHDALKIRSNDTVCINTIVNLIGYGVKKDFQGDNNIIYKILHYQNVEQAYKIKLLINLIGTDGLDYDLPIIIGKKSYSVKDRLEFFKIN